MGQVISVVGATTAIGRVVLNVLSEQGYPRDGVVAVSCSEGVGKSVSYGEGFNLVCAGIEGYDFSKAAVAVFAASDAISERYVGKAASCGCVVVDHSSFSRTNDDVSLVVPGVNDLDVGLYKKGSIVATVGSCASVIATVLYPLHKFGNIERVVVSTYHSVSHLGRDAMTELYDQTKSILMNKKAVGNEFAKQISFNCIPCVGELNNEGCAEEETLISGELNMVLGGVHAVVSCSIVPVFVSHSAWVNVEFSRQVSVGDVFDLLEEAPNVLVVDRGSDMGYITPIDCVNDDEVYVSRIRMDSTVPHGLSMWISADNLRRSALDLVSVAKAAMENL
ncbi:MAG: aspartate-semialdehyde dehydrogenase [Aaplasma endosymbiont of Hyalomma asiaticum]